MYSYISDISSEGTRTARIAIMDFVFFTGLAIGKGKFTTEIRHSFLCIVFFIMYCDFVLGISGKIFTTFGYEFVYVFAMIMNTLAILYAWLFVKESAKIKMARENLSADEKKPTIR